MIDTTHFYTLYKPKSTMILSFFTFQLSDYQLPGVACIFLFFAMLAYWISVAFPQNNTSFEIGKFLVIVSNFLFTTTLGTRWIEEKYFPLSNLYESLIFLSWGVSLILLILQEKTKSRLMGSLATPLLFFLAGFSSFALPIEMQKAMPLVPSLQSNWLMMHVSMMMVSYATLIVGSLLSILYLFFLFTIRNFNNLQLLKSSEVHFSTSRSSSNKLESTDTETSPPELGLRPANFPFMQNLPEQTASVNFPFVQRLPKEATADGRVGMDSLSSSQLSLLQTVDIWSYRIIGLGFPFLTIGIISGAVWANEAWGSYWSWDPKETWALITWLVFAIYLHSRLIKGWEAAKAATLGSCGFFVIWICYLGVNFLGKGLHSYGWVL